MKQFNLKGTKKKKWIQLNQLDNKNELNQLLKIFKENDIKLEDLKHLICPDCKVDIITNKRYMDCRECKEKMEEFEFRKNIFICNNCQRLWKSYIYNSKCSECR
jgi:hypothetical protein